MRGSHDLLSETAARFGTEVLRSEDLAMMSLTINLGSRQSAATT